MTVKDVKQWVRDWQLDDIEGAFKRARAARNRDELYTSVSDLVEALHALHEHGREALDRLIDAGAG